MCSPSAGLLPFHPTSAQLVDIVSSTGLSLDPVYTLKGVRGLLAEMGKNPGRFAGERVLYIHTGAPTAYYYTGTAREAKF